jgi:hypothetical protein
LSPEELVEIEQIRQLKARYFHLMDQKRWDEWADVFCEDVLVDTTQEGSPLLEGRQAFCDFLPPILQDVKTVHHGHLSEIELTGSDTATGVWSMKTTCGGRRTRAGATCGGPASTSRSTAGTRTAAGASWR